MEKIASRIDEDLNRVVEALSDEDVGVTDTKSDFLRQAVKREVLLVHDSEVVDPEAIADEMEMEWDDYTAFIERLRDDVPQYGGEAQSDIVEDAEEVIAVDDPQTGEPVPDEYADDVEARITRGEMTDEEIDQLLSDIGINPRPVGPLGIPIPRASVQYRRVS